LKESDSIKISEVIGILSGLSVILTIIYVYGFSKSSGIFLFRYFTINDFLKISIEWLTPSLIGFLISILFYLFTKRVEKGLSEEEIALTSKNPIFTWKFRKFSDTVPLYLIVTIAIIYVILSLFNLVSPLKLYSIWIIAGPFSWLIFISWYVKVPRLVKKWNSKYLILIIILPSIMLYSLFKGLYDGEKILSNKNNYSYTKILLMRNSKEMKGKIIFILNNYIIFIDKDSDSLRIFPPSRLKILQEMLKKSN